MAIFGKRPMFLALTLALLCPRALARSDETAELILNPTFALSNDKKLPMDWSVWEPVWAKAACRIRAISGGLLVDAPTNPYGVGGVAQQIKNVKGGQAYAIEASCRLQNVAAPYRSVLVRISCLASGAQVSLEVKWPRGGSVLWERVSMRPTSAPAPRKVKVGTVYLRPKRSSPESNLKLFCGQIDTAGKLGLDIVCLGEAITLVGTGRSVSDCAEPIPGAATRQLGNAARRNNIWVVAGLTELAGDIVYNTAVLLNRRGEIAGKYRKVHLPREEWKKGVTPGDTYPVFHTDFGTIAIQICYDWFFPEPETIFALKGAEIIFAPTWGNTLPDEDGRVEGESVFRVRARDNGVYMVPSVYDGNSLVIDAMGRILTSSQGKQGVFWAEIDLNTREKLPWVGYWRSIGPRHRMPHTYAPLSEVSQELTY